MLPAAQSLCWNEAHLMILCPLFPGKGKPGCRQRGILEQPEALAAVLRGTSCVLTWCHKNTGRKGTVFTGWLEILEPTINSLLSTRNQIQGWLLVSQACRSTGCPFKTGVDSLCDSFSHEPQPASRYLLWEFPFTQLRDCEREEPNPPSAGLRPAR